MNQSSRPLLGRIAAEDRLVGVPARVTQVLALAAVAGFAAAVMYWFHDRFWWPPDEGAYAHVAARILNGEILNRDVQDIHAGYVNFANALWLWIFGHDLVSLRYPLAAMAVVQSCILFRILLTFGWLPALAGSLAMTSLSAVQFLNPTAHWYALFIFVLIVWVLAAVEREARWRLEAIGYLVVALFLFRQLSGLVVAMGVVAYLLGETRGPRRAGNPWLSRSLALAMGAGLVAYFSLKAGTLALVLFGIGPIGALAWTACVASLGTGETLRLIGRLMLGGVAALAPLLAYHVAHGSLNSWLDDTVWSALRLTTLEFMQAPSYAALPFLGAAPVLSPENPASFLNGLFWIVLPLLPLALGVILAYGLYRYGRNGATHHPLPFLATFYAVVSAHYQIPIYLFYSTAIIIAGLLVLFGARNSWRSHGMAGIAVLLSAIGLFYQAGQPLSRGLTGIVAGIRVPLERAQDIPHASIMMTADDARTYREAIALIEREVPKDSPILAIPFNPELYFLSARRNPTRFFTSAFGIRDERELQATLDTLRQDPPVLVFHLPNDKYNTRLSNRLMDFVVSNYENLPPIGEFEIYRHRPRATMP